MTNYTPRVQQVLAFSREEAEGLGHRFVGSEHLLLGLLRLGNGVAVRALECRGVDLEAVRESIVDRVGTGPEPEEDRRIKRRLFDWLVIRETNPTIPYTPGVKRVLSLAAKEAKAMHHAYVGTEHLLLGLLREGDGIAARILGEFAVEHGPLRDEILRQLDPDFPSCGDPPSEPQTRPLFTALSTKNAIRVNGAGFRAIVIGVVRRDETAVSRVVTGLGEDFERAMREILAEIAPTDESEVEFYLVPLRAGGE
jgi:ATP-dependent Clp protease ATP-binding subunit ClpC